MDSVPLVDTKGEIAGLGLLTKHATLHLPVPKVQAPYRLLIFLSSRSVIVSGAKGRAACQTKGPKGGAEVPRFRAAQLPRRRDTASLAIMTQLRPHAVRTLPSPGLGSHWVLLSNSWEALVMIQMKSVRSV